MKYLALVFLLTWSLNGFSIERADCSDTAELFSFSKKFLDTQLRDEVNVLISKEISQLLTIGLNDFHDNNLESGYSSLEEALRMMRGNYGLYSSTQIKALVPLMEQTLSEKDFSRYYKYQNIFSNLILSRSKN